MRKSEEIASKIAELQAQLERERALEAIAADPTKGSRLIALLWVLKAAVNGIREIDPTALPEAFDAIKPQQFAKEGNVAKRIGLSESEAAAAKKKAEAAIAGL